MRFTVYSNDWFLEKLDNVCQFVRDGTHGSFKDVEIGIPLLSAKDIFDGKININENSRLISIDDYNTIHKNYELTKGDILLTIVGTIGRTAMVNMDEKFTLQRSVAILRVNEQISYNFLYYYIQTSAFQNRLKSVVNQSAQGGVYLNSLKKLNIKLTADMNEQNKISSFLSIIDKKIELLEQKYQYYQEFKKYLMQQIFTQKLRFADSDSCWKEISLKDIGTFYRGHSYNSTNVADEGLLVLRSNNIQGNVLDFSEDGLQFVDKDCKKELELQKNDIVICMSNGTRRLVGKSAEYTGNYENKVTVGAFCSIFRTKNKLAKYLFQTESYKKNLYLILAGTNINNLKNSDLEKFKFNIPTNESEINKIHDLFVSIDNKIDYNKKQLEEITLFKKGLLQQMFVVQLILSLLQNKKHI